MKKFISILLLIATLFFAFFIIYKINNKLKQKKQIELQIKKLPNFYLLSMSGDTLSSENFKNKPILFIYFDSTCIYCKNEIEIIHTNKSQIKNVEIFFISNEEVETIKEFSKKFNFEGNHNIRFTHDINLGFYKKYNIIITPTLFFYNKDAILVKVQKGPITFKQFQDIINIEF